MWSWMVVDGRDISEGRKPVLLERSIRPDRLLVHDTVAGRLIVACHSDRQRIPPHIYSLSCM